MIYVRPCAPLGQVISPVTEERLRAGVQRAGEFAQTPLGRAVVVGLIAAGTAKAFPGKFLAPLIAGTLAASRTGVTGMRPQLPGIS